MKSSRPVEVIYLEYLVITAFVKTVLQFHFSEFLNI